MNILFIDACARENSRTRMLAGHLLKKLGGKAERLPLYDERIKPLEEDGITKRELLSEKKDIEDPLIKYAVKFKNADVIVIAAPYWDLSFPSVLKNFFEAVSVVGITFRYSEEGIPVGLCRAKKLFYVTTAGGPLVTEDYSFGYVDALCRLYYGINDTCLISCENLDVIGADEQAIIAEAEEKIDRAAEDFKWMK